MKRKTTPKNHDPKWQPRIKPDGRFAYYWEGKLIRTDDCHPNWGKGPINYMLIFRMIGWFLKEIFELLTGKRKWD